MTTNDVGADRCETRAELWGAKVGLVACFALAAGWVEAAVVWLVQL